MESEKGWSLVDRIYMALMRLASATLVIGFIVIVMIKINSGQLYPNSSSGDLQYFGGDQQSVFLYTLLYSMPQILAATAAYLMDGVALLGIVVAWADHRRAWTLALIVAVMVALVFPFSFAYAGHFYAIHPRIGSLIEQNALLLVYLLSLVPVALALAMARVQGGGRAALRVEADAALEITRSSL